MKLYDVHSHLHYEKLAPSLHATIDSAKKAGVTSINCCGTSENDWQDVITLVEKYNFIKPSFGIHPWYSADATPLWNSRLMELLTLYPDAAIGETGLDFKHNDNRKTQVTVLNEHFEIAHKTKRPVSLHCISAWKELMQILIAHKKKGIRFMLHSYSGSSSDIYPLSRLGAYFSFSAALTYPNREKLVNALKSVPPDRLLFESDAPSQSPYGSEESPVNKPDSIFGTIKVAAEILSIDMELLAETTYRNSLTFFEKHE